MDWEVVAVNVVFLRKITVWFQTNQPKGQLFRISFGKCTELPYRGRQEMCQPCLKFGEEEKCNLSKKDSFKG
jgi:hypothetical protein